MITIRSLLPVPFLIGAILTAGPAFAQNAIVPIHYAEQDWFIPPHVGGDADFKGNGPSILLDVALYIHPHAPHEVWARVLLDALETKHDWTHARGVRHVKVATFARPVHVILTPTRLVNPDGTIGFRYIDTNTAVDRFFNPCACGLLNEVQFVGDTKGPEAGTRTGVKLRFNPILAR
jgi:hypothetical protein